MVQFLKLVIKMNSKPLYLDQGVSFNWTVWEVRPPSVASHIGQDGRCAVLPPEALSVRGDC